jgi:hypothetical protein
MARRNTIAALAVAIGTACVPSMASAQSFVADLVAAPFYIAANTLAATGSIVAGPSFGYYPYPGVYPDFPGYGPPPAPYAPSYYPSAPVTYYYGPSCGYDPWGRWACAVR